MADSPKPDNVIHTQLASAVVIPEISPSPPSPPATNGHTAPLKRRASELPYDDDDTNNAAEDPHAKRARLHSAASNGSVPSQQQSTAQSSRHRPTKPAADIEADRKRGKRLFGSLLGTLSQSASAGAAQQRRADAERRQRDKLAALSLSSGSAHRPLHPGSRNGEAEEQPGARRRTAQELAELETQRRGQQRDWEEDEMRVRHASMRARARYLCTNVEPRIYWLPYELTAREERVLDEQKESVEDAIAKDKDEFMKARAESNGGEEVQLDQAPVPEEVRDAGEDQERTSPEQNQSEDTTNRDENEDNRLATTEDVITQGSAGGATSDGNDGKDNGEDDEEIPLNRDPEEDPVLY